MTAPRITATCVTRALQPCTSRDATPSGINKGPVNAVELTTTGVGGDEVRDTVHHGGADKAAYAYADEDADWWAQRLGEAVPPGLFGENLRTTGLDLRAAVIGSRWTIGDHVMVEVSEPRVPCSTFQHHMDDRSGWVKDFTAAGRTGTYLRVLQPGRVTPGDRIKVAHVPDHGVTIGGWFSRNDPADARRLLAAESSQWQLPTALRSYVEAVLARAT